MDATDQLTDVDTQDAAAASAKQHTSNNKGTQNLYFSILLVKALIFCPLDIMESLLDSIMS